MSKNANDDSSFVKRYLALKALRENILYTEPVKDSLVSSVEDIPGPTRAIAGPLAEPLATRAIISEKPEVRRVQIAEAAKRVREAEDPSARNHQMLTNALRLGAAGAPVGFLAGGALSLLGKGRLPFGRGGFRSPFPSFGRNVRHVFSPGGEGPFNGRNRAAMARRVLLNDARKGALESGALSAVAGASAGAAAGAGKPGDEDIEAASKILQDHPYASALPGAEASAVYESMDPDRSAGKAALIGAAGGAAAAVPATFLPPTLESAGTVAKNTTNYLKSLRSGATPKYRNPMLLRRLAGAGRRNLVNNALLLGLLGMGGGYASSQNASV